MAEDWKKVCGIAFETGGWPPASSTDPTVWFPGMTEADFQQEPAIVDVPDTRGDRAEYLQPLGGFTTTGSVRDAYITMGIARLLLPHVFAKLSDTAYYERFDGAPGDAGSAAYPLSVTFEKGGIWRAGIGCFVKSLEMLYSSNVLTANIDLSGYSVVTPSPTPTPSFNNPIKLFPLHNLKVILDSSEVHVTDVTFRAETGVPDTDLRSGSQYPAALTQGKLAVSVEFSVEASGTIWDNIKSGHEYNVVLEMKNQDSTEKIVIELPQLRVNPSRHDDSEDRNLLFTKLACNALVDTTLGYETRVYLA